MGPYPDTDWEPVALELPLEDPSRRNPARPMGPAGPVRPVRPVWPVWIEDERLQDDSEDLGPTVIVIDLA